MKSNKGQSTPLAVVIILALLIIGVVLWNMYPRPQPQPSALTFNLDFPNSIIAGKTSTANIVVTNNGADASGVTAVIVSDAITTSLNALDVKGGSRVTLPVSMTGKDMPDGPYAVVVYLQYSDALGTDKTASQGVSIYLLPALQLADIRYQWDILHPLGKSTIGTADGTVLLFKVKSESVAVIYSGMSMTAKLATTVPGLSVLNSSLQIGPIGPNGITSDYAIQIVSNHAPPGTYTIQLSLYSKDNQLIAQQTVKITITG